MRKNNRILKLTREKAVENFDYDTETGNLYHAKDKNSGAIPRGSLAGYIDSCGYRRVKVNSVVYLAHHVAWLIYYGEYCLEEMDHINCDRADNRISNLRLSNRPQNSQNQTLKSSNTSGVKGVSYCPYGRKKAYRAQINVNKEVFKQDFLTLEEAEAWLFVMRTELHGEYARFE